MAPCGQTTQIGCFTGGWRSLDMTHIDLVEQLRVLEDLHKRNVGNDGNVYVCRACYAEFDPKGCHCGRNSWTLVAAVMVEIRLSLSDEKVVGAAHDAHASE